jgi:hypothetical protein
MSHQSEPINLPGPVEEFTADPTSPLTEWDGIKLGDIATHLFWGHGAGVAQGCIYRIDPSEEFPVSLQIFDENSWILGADFRPGQVNLIYCKPDELKVDEPQQWNVEGLWKRLFRHVSHSLRTPDPSVVDLSICAHKDCWEDSTQWILFNFVGSVFQLYVCKEHARLHGMCSEDYPFEYKKHVARMA